MKAVYLGYNIHDGHNKLMYMYVCNQCFSSSYINVGLDLRKCGQLFPGVLFRNGMTFSWAIFNKLELKKLFRLKPRSHMYCYLSATALRLKNS